MTQGSGGRYGTPPAIRREEPSHPELDPMNMHLRLVALETGRAHMSEQLDAIGARTEAIADTVGKLRDSLIEARGRDEGSSAARTEASAMSERREKRLMWLAGFVLSLIIALSGAAAYFAAHYTR